MCAKLGHKYKVANPLEEATQSTPAKTESLGSGIGTGSAQTPFSSAGDNKSSSTGQKPPLGASSFGSGQGGPFGGSSSSTVFGGLSSDGSSASASSPFGTSTPAPAPSQSPFGTTPPSPAPGPSPFVSSSPAPVQSPFRTSTPGPAPAPSPFASSTPAPVQSPFASSTPAPAFGSMASQSPFGQQSSGGFSSTPFSQPPASSPFGATAAAAPSTMAPGSTTFLGKSPRELLTAFYQEKNPTKLSEVDKLLASTREKKSKCLEIWQRNTAWMHLSLAFQWQLQRLRLVLVPQVQASLDHQDSASPRRWVEEAHLAHRRHHLVEHQGAALAPHHQRLVKDSGRLRVHLPLEVKALVLLRTPLRSQDLARLVPLRHKQRRSAQTQVLSEHRDGSRMLHVSIRDSRPACS